MELTVCGSDCYIEYRSVYGEFLEEGSVKEPILVGIFPEDVTGNMWIPEPPVPQR